MEPKYPNLELLVYKAKCLLFKDQDFLDRYSKRNSTNVSINCDVEVFPQWWGSTITGFDVLEDGSPAFGGSAMTKEYTTVIYDYITDIYVVFFGNRVCYLVKDYDEKFLNDLKDRCLLGLRDARKYYQFSKSIVFYCQGIVYLFMY